MRVRTGLRAGKLLGALAERFTRATGLEALAEKYTEKTGKDCGCAKRQAILNAMSPFAMTNRVKSAICSTTSSGKLSICWYNCSRIVAVAIALTSQNAPSNRAENVGCREPRAPRPAAQTLPSYVYGHYYHRCVLSANRACNWPRRPSHASANVSPGFRGKV